MSRQCSDSAFCCRGVAARIACTKRFGNEHGDPDLLLKMGEVGPLQNTIRVLRRPGLTCISCEASRSWGREDGLGRSSSALSTRTVQYPPRPCYDEICHLTSHIKVCCSRCYRLLVFCSPCRGETRLPRKSMLSSPSRYGSHDSDFQSRPHLQVGPYSRACRLTTEDHPCIPYFVEGRRIPMYIC